MRDDKFWGYVIVEVAPFGILLLYQIEFPDAVHMLDCIFTLGRRDGIFMALEIDQLVNCVLAGDAYDKIAFMIQDTVCQVLGHPDVECTVAFAGEDVSVVSFFHC